MNPGDITSNALRAAYTQTKTLPSTVSSGYDIMGGHGTITLVGAGEDLLARCWDVARGCEQLWSRFISTSDISRLNWAEGHPVEVSSLTKRLVAEMIAGKRLTGGAYDPTLLPDVLSAGYRASRVNAEQVTTLPDSARAPGRLDQIDIGERSITLPVGTTLDPGGIGKGFTADVLCEFALAEGALGVMVELGGDIVMRGNAPDGVAWNVGIENPHAAEGHLSIVRIKSGAIATSSQLKRRFLLEGQETHHLIDAGSHLSAHSSAQTITVIAATGARAEVLTKPGFVREPADYLEWLPTVGAAGLIVLADGSTLSSPNWSNYA